MSRHHQWLNVAVVVSVAVLVALWMVPRGGGDAVLGFIAGAAVVHALHMAYPSFAAEAESQPNKETR